MLKCFNLSPQNLFQIAKNFYAIKLLPFKTSCFIRSSLRVELVFDNTAGYFPLNFWKKNQNWKLRKKVTSFKSFVWTRTRQFGELRRLFFAEFLNVFPSQSKQLCKFLTTPKKNIFPQIFPLDTSNTVWTVLNFFSLNVQILLPQKPKRNWNW